MWVKASDELTDDAAGTEDEVDLEWCEVKVDRLEVEEESAAS